MNKCMKNDENYTLNLHPLQNEQKEKKIIKRRENVSKREMLDRLKKAE